MTSRRARRRRLSSDEESSDGDDNHHLYTLRVSLEEDDVNNDDMLVCDIRRSRHEPLVVVPVSVLLINSPSRCGTNGADLPR